MEHIKFKIFNNIIKFYSTDYSIDQMIQYKEDIEKSINKDIKYILYTNCLGYHSGYDCNLNKHIYIGDLSEKRSLEKLKNE